MTITSSTGGQIVKTKDGLIHHTNPKRFADDENNTVERVKFDLSALLPNEVKLTGPVGRIVTFK